VKFHQVVYKMSRSQTFRMHARTDRQPHNITTPALHGGTGIKIYANYKLGTSLFTDQLSIHP